MVVNSFRSRCAVSSCRAPPACSTPIAPGDSGGAAAARPASVQRPGLGERDDRRSRRAARRLRAGHRASAKSRRPPATVDARRANARGADDHQPDVRRLAPRTARAARASTSARRRIASSTIRDACRRSKWAAQRRQKPSGRRAGTILHVRQRSPCRRSFTPTAAATPAHAGRLGRKRSAVPRRAGPTMGSRQRSPRRVAIRSVAGGAEPGARRRPADARRAARSRRSR